ncbi:MAG: YbaN family protein [Clostridium sp.]|nr:YbaN family protein [Clostridium sp.]
MKSIKKYFYIGIGLITLILGIIGVILPILPTTPFLLITSFCFAKGSEKFHNWFINTKLYKKHLESFVKERAMTLKEKVVLLTFVNIMLAFPLIMVDVLPMRITIIVLIIIKLYYFIFRVRTVTPEEKRKMEIKRNSLNM